LLEVLERSEDGLRKWTEEVSSVFVHAGTNLPALLALARKLTAAPALSFHSIDRDTEWTVSSEATNFTRSMSGIRVKSVGQAKVSAFPRASLPSGTQALITCETGIALLKCDYRGVPVILSTAPDVIDLDAPLTGQNFDLRAHFLAAAPVVMFLTWACAGVCWHPAEMRACLVIDDPLLTPRYGFLHYETLIEQMQLHNFATSIAFIPWNWRRSRMRTARLFKSQSSQLSISIHGCDHTGGEFGTRHAGRLAWKTRQAAERMARHETMTGVRHDRVMVFPQGVFSEAAMKALKRGQFIGVVNTELLSNDVPQPAITVRDAWATALMRYGSFPIYTRRYPRDGVENFAFDILLGKPCIAVIHHNDCKGRYRDLLPWIDRLNALNGRLIWCNLEEIVLRGYRQKEVGADRIEVEMFGSEMRLTNPHRQRKLFVIHKQESEPAVITTITVDQKPIAWKHEAGSIGFEIELEAGATKSVVVAFSPQTESGFNGEDLTYRIKATARRVLSEIRDNYVVRKPFSA
jgi:hypothetical protein